MDNILDFNADDARKLAESIVNDELRHVLGKVKNKAEIRDGQNQVYIYQKLHHKTINTLQAKGFVVDEASGFAVQKDGECTTTA